MSLRTAVPCLLAVLGCSAPGPAVETEPALPPPPEEPSVFVTRVEPSTAMRRIHVRIHNPPTGKRIPYTWQTGVCLSAQVLRDGEWKPVKRFRCGTGIEERWLEPGADLFAWDALPWSAGSPVRVGFRYCLPDSSEWLAVWSEPVD